VCAALAIAGVYNFAGDLGKAALPGATSLLIVFMPWHYALWIVSGIGVRDDVSASRYSARP
jgi:MFS transporter, FSR family, fosmidomycin resistance protein